MRRLPGEHVPNIKNRSSKQIGWFCGHGHKLAVRSMSNAELKSMQGDKNAMREITRRANKRAKRGAAENKA